MEGDNVVSIYLLLAGRIWRMCLIPCSLFRGARFFIKNVTPGFFIALSECFVRELYILMCQVFAATWMIPRQETESSKEWSRGRWQFRERWPSVKLWGWELENSSELVWNYFPFMCHDLFETVLHILAFSLWLYLVWPLYKKRLSLIGRKIYKKTIKNLTPRKIAFFIFCKF